MAVVSDNIATIIKFPVEEDTAALVRAFHLAFPGIKLTPEILGHVRELYLRKYKPQKEGVA